MKTTMTRLRNVCLAAAAGLLLAGCSATHVGESWQCPLAQGSSCASIAEADPAVPAGAAGAAVLFGEPLHDFRRNGGEACTGGCGPLAWLRELFGAGTDNDPAPIPPAVPATVTAVGQDGAAPSTAPGPAIAADAVPVKDASLRVPEVLGRIWIAPFVDADGIYREAHWVRVVLEPAGWKLP